MRPIHLALALVSLAWIAIPSSAHADTSLNNVTITELAQEGDHQYEIYTSSSPSTSCTYQRPLILEYTNSPYASFDSMAPILMAAFLYNKTISFTLHGCDSGVSRPVIV